MKGMGVGSTFRDLDVYQLATKAAAEMSELTAAIRKDERFPPADQIKRSLCATEAMIAEASACRRGKAFFVNKIDEALGEAGAGDWRFIATMPAPMIGRAGEFSITVPDADYRLLEEAPDCERER